MPKRHLSTTFFSPFMLQQKIKINKQKHRLLNNLIVQLYLTAKEKSFIQEMHPILTTLN